MWLLILFRFDFIVYQAINHPPQYVTGNNFKRKVNYFANFYVAFDDKGITDLIRSSKLVKMISSYLLLTKLEKYFYSFKKI